MKGRRTRAARKAAATLGILVALAASGACARRQAKAAGPTAVPVVAARVETRDVPVEAAAIGSVEAYTTVSLRPQVSGPIAKVHFVEGQEVKVGDLLFTIDPRPFEAALEQAKAKLARDRAQAERSRVDTERQAQLFSQGAVSQRRPLDTFGTPRPQVAARRRARGRGRGRRGASSISSYTRIARADRRAAPAACSSTRATW